MGLDSVEILVNVENAFGITISNYEAEKISTVGDIHSLVWRSIQGRESMRCKSQQLFYKLRYTLISKFQIARDDIALKASLNDIFPKENRRLLYRKLAKELQMKLPALVLPAPWRNALVITGVLLVPGMLVYTLIMVKVFNYTSWLYVLPVLGILATRFISNILDSVRTVFEPALLNEYTRKVLSLNYATMIRDNDANRKEIEMVINQIIADQSGLEIHEITPEKRLGDDLGID
jgi:acyl carrier protein